MGSNGQYDDLARASSTGASSGDGGDAARPAPPRLPLSPPPTSPSRDPKALSTSPPPLQPPRSPPLPVDQDTDRGPENGDLQEEENDEDPTPDNGYLREEENYEDEGLDDNYMPEEIDDGGWNWKKGEAKYNYGHLGEGELEDDANSGELEVGDGQDRGENLMRPPKDYPRAVEFTEPILDLILKSSNNDTIQEKIKILRKQYGLFRRTRSDGNCFYRALLFSYLENLEQMQDRQAEVTRLMKCVEASIKKIKQLKWGDTYFLNPKGNFLSVVDEFYHLVNSVANGLTCDKLYERSLSDTSSGRITYFLRLLTDAEIRTEDIYKPYIPKDMNVLEFCRNNVLSPYAEAESIQMRALTYALGIPLRVEIVDTKSTSGQAVRVKRLDFFRQSSLGKGRVHIVRSYYSSSTAHKPLKRGRGDELLSSDGAPLVTLLSRRGHCDILYPK